MRWVGKNRALDKGMEKGFLALCLTSIYGLNAFRYFTLARKRFYTLQKPLGANQFYAVLFFEIQTSFVLSLIGFLAESFPKYV